MNTTNTWYTVNKIDEIDSPALLVYPEKIKANIDHLKLWVNDTTRLRPHVKTHKMIEVVKLMLNEGIHKFKCATIAEAEMLAMAGAKDILLAYQPVGPKVHRLLQLTVNFPETKFSCLVDSVLQMHAIAIVFNENGSSIEVFIDINSGMNRTGIPPGKEALELYLEMDKVNGVMAKGLHAYDGHIRDLDFETRKQKCNEAFEAVVDLAEAIIDKGQPKPVIVAGGSPTFPVHAQRNDVECSPGTFIFWDWGYHIGLPEQKFQFAALVFTRVISILDKNLLCLDLGHKAIAAENPLPRVHFLNAPDAESISQSEEHLVIKVDDTSHFSLGDVLYGVPFHICPTCALYENAYVVDNEPIISSWKVISRNRFINF